MIDQKQISIEWLVKVSKENGNADKIIAEKVIRAMLLLEGLVKQKLPFVFKGGTSLMLHFNRAKRLSIDIDIIRWKLENYYHCEHKLHQLDEPSLFKMMIRRKSV